mmetsp:Transcript_2367/g.9839  ORF Transcript_2367/g.9839 Transcript_2367/m.9839 type:complete len:225 (-) Transcript_2367:2594-3268(-)
MIVPDRSTRALARRRIRPRASLFHARHPRPTASDSHALAPSPSPVRRLRDARRRRRGRLRAPERRLQPGVPQLTESGAGGVRPRAHRRRAVQSRERDGPERRVRAGRGRPEREQDPLAVHGQPRGGNPRHVRPGRVLRRRAVCGADAAGDAPRDGAGDPVRRRSPRRDDGSRGLSGGDGYGAHAQPADDGRVRPGRRATRRRAQPAVAHELAGAEAVLRVRGGG